MLFVNTLSLPDGLTARALQRLAGDLPELVRPIVPESRGQRARLDLIGTELVQALPRTVAA